MVIEKIPFNSYWTDKKPENIEMLGETYYAGDWIYAVIWIIKILLEKGLIEKETLLEYYRFYGSRRHYFGTDRGKMSRPKMIDSELYIEANQNANTLRDIALNVLKLAGLNQDDVILYRRDVKDKIDCDLLLNYQSDKEQ